MWLLASLFSSSYSFVLFSILLSSFSIRPQMRAGLSSHSVLFLDVIPYHKVKCDFILVLSQIYIPSPDLCVFQIHIPNPSPATCSGMFPRGVRFKLPKTDGSVCPTHLAACPIWLFSQFTKPPFTQLLGPEMQVSLLIPLSLPSCSSSIRDLY